jgi:hypothetical protein
MGRGAGEKLGEGVCPARVWPIHDICKSRPDRWPLRTTQELYVPGRTGQLERALCRECSCLIGDGLFTFCEKNETYLLPVRAKRQHSLLLCRLNSDTPPLIPTTPEYYYLPSMWNVAVLVPISFLVTDDDPLYGNSPDPCPMPIRKPCRQLYLRTSSLKEKPWAACVACEANQGRISTRYN